MTDEPGRYIVVDTDPGLDDAIALWLAAASPEIDFAAVLATAGNVGLDRTLPNACAIIALSGRGVPVHAGATRPFAGRTAEAAHVHGQDGLGAIRLPPGPPAAPGLAADRLRALLHAAARPVTLVGIGPVTNLALALATEPALAGRIDEIVLMSGAVGPGNITPHAEFNSYADPEALAVVLAAGLLVTFATLDLTAQAALQPADLDRIAGAGEGRCLAAAAALLRAIPPEPAGRPVHDACAIAWLIRPALFTHRDRHAAVILDGEQRGRTVFSEPGAAHPANARTLETIDRAGFIDLLAERLARLP